MEDKFKEIIKQLNYEEWRQYKTRIKHEVLVDPHSPIWNYIDNQGNIYNSEKKFFEMGSDEILKQIEKNQNILFITLKRRRKVEVNSEEWHNFTEKIETVNKNLDFLNMLINEIYPKDKEKEE